MSQSNTSKPSQDLEKLFEFATPESLRKSLNSLLMDYLMHMDERVIPENFKTVVSDMYYLQDFLEKSVGGAEVE